MIGHRGPADEGHKTPVMRLLTDGFYVTGGTLPIDAASYVVRPADTALLEGLRQGQFCYVLTSRQMGKSSLMVRTATRLRQEGVACAVLDLTALGLHLAQERWYDGLLNMVARQFGLEDELEEFWLSHERVSLMQRWMRAIREVALEKTESPIVLFIDEIDAVRSLPFAPDEFFAGIRECYNRRAEDPVLNRLSFCLLGVASPTDLIRDTRTTPFNIGRRIELTDFTLEDAQPLVAGLKGHSQALLKRVLFWTGGHPYLTQRHCQAVAEDASITTPQGVDQLCREIFLSARAREQDDNLLFVRDRLLRSEEDLASLLDTYRRVLAGRPVRSEETNPLVTVLRLAGVVRTDGEFLKPRNRIYASVFDREWVRAHTPGAELRRQRAAYRRGLLRAAGLASIVVAILGVLVLVAVRNALRANRNQQTAQTATMLANAEADRAYHLLYNANSSLAQQDYESGNIPDMLEKLDQMRPQPGKPDLRGFEWYYLQGLCHQGLRILRGDQNPLAFLTFSPKGDLLACADDYGALWLWDPATGRLLRQFHHAQAASLAFSPDGKLLAAGGQSLTLWDTATWRPVRVLNASVPAGAFSPITHIGIHTVAFSPDGKLLASGGGDRMVRFWDVATGRQIRALPAGTDRGPWSVAFSPDGKTLAAGCDDHLVRLYDVATGRLKQILRNHSWYVYSVAYSPNGKLLASTGGDSTIILWDPKTGRLLNMLYGHTSYVYSVAFSPDSKLLASASWDGTVRIIQTPPSGRSWRALPGHTTYMTCVAFSPDGRTLAAGGYDRTVKLWDPTLQAGAHEVNWPGWNVHTRYLSPQGTLFLVDYDGVVRDGLTRRFLFKLPASDKDAGILACSPDNRLLATVQGKEESAAIWDVATGRRLVSLGTGIFANEQVLATGSNEGYRNYPIDFSPNGQRVMTVYRGKPTCIWDTRTGRRLLTLPQGVSQAAFSPDGRFIVCAEYGPDAIGIEVFDAATGRKLYALSTGDMTPTHAVFSPDGSHIAVIGVGKKNSGISGAEVAATAEVFDTRSRRAPILLKGHTEKITSIGFSPDGERIITGSLDNTVRLWNAVTGSETLTLRADTSVGRVTQVAFTPDGKHIIMVGAFGTVKVWDAATDAQIAAWEAERQIAAGPHLTP